MTTNPYQAPDTPVHDHVSAIAPLHTRSLWIGVALSSVAPVLLLMVPMLLLKGIPPNPGVSSAVMALAVIVVALIPSTTASVGVGLPLVLLLRRLGRLHGAWVCVLAILAGAGVGAVLLMLPGLIAPHLIDVPQAKTAARGSMTGAVSGLASGLGMVIGAGIPFRRRAAKPRPRTSRAR